jgi:hypothetical protein
MNMFFGNQLRRALIDLMGRSEFLRARAPSIGSQRLSLDSVGDLGRNNVLPISEATFSEADY